jgi:predicted transposase YbfD/YdcC
MDSKLLNIIIEDLEIRFPVATISRDLNMSKGIVSEYINNKKVPSENFINLFEKHYKINSKNYLRNKKHQVTDEDLFALEIINRHEELMKKSKTYRGHIEGLIDKALVKITSSKESFTEYLDSKNQ